MENPKIEGSTSDSHGISLHFQPIGNAMQIIFVARNLKDDWCWRKEKFPNLLWDSEETRASETVKKKKFSSRGKNASSFR